jgi:hypothetical protein
MTQKIEMSLVSMDHSPSEQLVDPETWHTTVIVMSEGGIGEQQLAELLQFRNGAPLKWTKTNYDHRTKFERALERLDRSLVFAISAQAKTIESSFQALVSEFGLNNLVTTLSKNNKPYISFGPFRRSKIVTKNGMLQEEELAPLIIPLSKNQAVPLIFIYAFLVRSHKQCLSLVRQAKPSIEWIDWQIMPNKFPGDIQGPMSSLFGALASAGSGLGHVCGNFRVMHFHDSNIELGSVLADNIAGMLDAKLRSGQVANSWGPVSSRCGINWEIRSE